MSQQETCYIQEMREYFCSTFCSFVQHTTVHKCVASCCIYLTCAKLTKMQPSRMNLATKQTVVCQHTAIHQSRRQFRWRRWSLQHFVWTMLCCCCLSSRPQLLRLLQVMLCLIKGLSSSVSEDCSFPVRNGRHFGHIIILAKSHFFCILPYYFVEQKCFQMWSEIVAVIIIIIVIKRIL